jgi:hypothetical protein
VRGKTLISSCYSVRAGLNEAPRKPFKISDGGADNHGVNAQVKSTPDMPGLMHPSLKNDGNVHFPHQPAGQVKRWALAVPGVLGVAAERCAHHVKAQPGGLYPLPERCDVGHQNPVKICLCGGDDFCERLAARAGAFRGVHSDDLRACAIYTADGVERWRNVDFGIRIVYLFNAKDRDMNGSEDGAYVGHAPNSDGNRSLFFSNSRHSGNELGAVEGRTGPWLAGNNQPVLEL